MKAVILLLVLNVGCSSKAAALIDAEPDSGVTVLADGGILLADGAIVAQDGAVLAADGAVVSPPNPGITSGTRLRARVIVSSDGAEQFAGWHDSSRNEDCSFTTAADGIMRCEPTGLGVGGIFSNATCTQLVAYQAAACSAPAYMVYSEPTTNGCFTAYRLHIYTASSKISAPTTVYTLSAGVCKASGIVPSTLGDFYSASSEVPASSFQDATVVVK
jgi:hypothetical protein